MTMQNGFNKQDFLATFNDLTSYNRGQKSTRHLTEDAQPPLPPNQSLEPPKFCSLNVASGKGGGGCKASSCLNLFISFFLGL